MKVRNKITIKRVQWLALLVFAEAFFIPLYTVLQSGRFPNTVECAQYLVGGAIQVVTILLAFIKRDSE